MHLEIFDGESPADVLRALRVLLPMVGLPLLGVQVAVDRLDWNASHYLNVQPNEHPGFLYNPRVMQSQINKHLVRTDNNPGSDTFIKDGGPPPIANYSDVILTFGELGTVVRSVEDEGVGLIAYVNPGALNRRRAQGNVVYPTAKKGRTSYPWLFKAVDGSHDPLTFKDDGKCCERVLRHFKLEGYIAQCLTLTAIKFLKFVTDMNLVVNGRKTQILTPTAGYFNALRFMDERYADPHYPYDLDRPYLRMSSPKNALAVMSHHFAAPPQDVDVILFDNATHVAIPLMANVRGTMHIAVSPNYYIAGENNLYYHHQTPVGKREDLPRTVTHFNNPDYLSEVGYSFHCVLNSGTETRLASAAQGRYAYCAFDFETCYGPDKVLRAYSVSWVMVDVDPETLMPKGGLTEEFKKSLPGKAQFYAGSDAAFHFAQVITNKRYGDGVEQPYEKIVGLTFNGSNFDHLLLYEAFLTANDNAKWDRSHLVKVTDEFWMGTSLAKFEVDHMFSVFDVKRHLVGSLGHNCEAFNCLNKKEGAAFPSHDKIQELYETVFDFDLGKMFASTTELLPEGKTLEDFPTFRDCLRHYNVYDVASLMELFFLYRSNNLVKSEKSKQLCPPLTMASESFGSWSERFAVRKAEHVEDRLKILGGWNPIRYKIYRDIRRTLVAGRTQTFQPPLFVNEKCVSMDVVSLYPYVMAIAPVYYPVGDHKLYKLNWSPDEVEEKFSSITRLGLFRVAVDQSVLVTRGLPMILANKVPVNPLNLASSRNDWHSPVVNDTWITGKEVEVLLANDCRIAINDALLWDEKIKSVDLFHEIGELMHAKNEQDTFKATKDPRYNVAIRQGSKLAQNALYGKMIENFHVDKRMTVTPEEYMVIMDDIRGFGPHNKWKSCSSVYEFNGRMIVDAKKDESKMRQASQRPLGVGMYILAYSRMYMWENTYSKLGTEACLYTDTDAIKCRESDYVRLLEHHFTTTEVPHWPEAEEFDPKLKGHMMFDPHSKVYGGFDNEFMDNKSPALHNNKGLWIIAKKMWGCVPEDPSIAKDWKLGTKAVFMGDVILTDAQVKELKDETLTPLERYNISQGFFSTKANQVGESPERFFKTLLKKPHLWLLKKDISKNVTQHKRNVMWLPADPNTESLVDGFSQLRSKFRLMKLCPKNNQEVEEVVLRNY